MFPIRPFSLLLILFCLLQSCSNDYVDEGIEGRWQLQHVESSNGETILVDTIFYSFKKNVFEYLKLTTPTTSFHCFGNYRIKSDSIKISIDETSFEPKDMGTEFDWNNLQRLFLIKKHSSSQLVLKTEEGLYLNLKKY